MTDHFARFAPTPQLVASGVEASRLAVGMGNVCALFEYGVTKCWLGADVGPGEGLYGPLHIGSAPSFVDLATGTYPLCGLSNGERLYCWDTTLEWRLHGNPDDGPPMTDPVLVPLEGVLSIGHSFDWSGRFSCARSRGLPGSVGVSCWGDNDSGQLGNGSTIPYFDTPTAVAFP